MNGGTPSVARGFKIRRVDGLYVNDKKRPEFLDRSPVVARGSRTQLSFQSTLVLRSLKPSFPSAINSTPISFDRETHIRCNSLCPNNLTLIGSDSRIGLQAGIDWQDGFDCLLIAPTTTPNQTANPQVIAKSRALVIKAQSAPSGFFLPIPH